MEELKEFHKVLFMKIEDICNRYPSAKAVFEQYSIPIISMEVTLHENLKAVGAHWLRDMGITAEFIVQQLEETERIYCEHDIDVKDITILGGYDKDGVREDKSVTLKCGDIVCISGTTGSGKTRFLEDIEYIASGDSPTGRVVLINGAVPTEEERVYLENRLCAYLSQTMNFVMELSCADFIRIHAQCRNLHITEEELTDLKSKVMECANALAGESFTEDVLVTQLSGGQSRALMIADIAYISNSLVVLIDEPENAGIDRDEILRLLSENGKIVMISTHDPVIALSCNKRIVIKNGGIFDIIKRTCFEKNFLEELRSYDKKIKRVRECLRNGIKIESEYVYEI